MGDGKSFLTGMGGPGDQPGIARNAAAGPMDAGSDAVATTRTTIFSDSPPSPALLLAASSYGFGGLLISGGNLRAVARRYGFSGGSARLCHGSEQYGPFARTFNG